MSTTELEHEGSYKASEMHENVEKEIARLREQALWGWDKEFRNLQWFGLQDGMPVLEVGSGPGFITEQLLRALPNSHITCVELDPDLIARAETYLQSKGLQGRYTIAHANLMRMDFPDNSFDFAFARLVFQHLRDPLGAATEILRVLKPGGKLAITDVDDGLRAIINPESDAADAISKKMEAGQERRGGDRKIGRKLWKLLAKAGYTNLDLESLVVHSDVERIESMMPDEWDPGAFKPFLDAGVITPEDVEVIRREHLNFVASDEKYALFPGLMWCGQKPE